MANNTVVKVVVEAKSKFGILNKLDGKWLNTRDEKVLAGFKIGSSYDIEMVPSKGKDGKTYMNIGTVVTTESVAPAAKVATKAFVKPAEAKPFVGGGMTASEKDSRILIQGLTQAVLQSPLMTYAKKGDELAYVEKLVTELAVLVKKLAA